MVTYYATKLTATCSPIIEQFADTMILASTAVESVIMTHQTVSLGKYLKLFSATLSRCISVKTSLINTKLGDFVNLDMLFLNI